MSQIFSVMLMVMNSLLFSYMSHPMNMGITLLLQTLMMCVMMGLMSYSSWFSYILFLVFLGGMLVLFIYMTSIASNELFKKSMYFSTVIMMMLTVMFLFSMLMDPFMVTNSMNSEVMMEINKSKMIMSPLYNNPTSIITTFMVLYLFLTLIVVVNITKFNKGPLRPMN
uniref:NADH dehydrogenase subunit 6 n=1 Tax=Leucorrhinia albifrons TaxID=213666 RepID=UPI00226CE282|nr:NADH dehydrogenase subunit 6 [Leucorrhinia albifrons]UZI00198.1 NADH dehydrogenase subunit 6 [Leucorrhinia albifrons]